MDDVDPHLPPQPEAGLQTPPPAPPKVVEHPSPLTGVARSGVALATGAVVILREFLSAERGDVSGTLVFIGIALLAIAVIAGIGGVLTWRTTTFIADDDEFRVERRLVSQSSTRVDYTKVQSVDITQPLVARLLGLARVHIDVGGAGGVDLSYLTKARAESLRDHLLARMHRARGVAMAPGEDGELAPAPEAAPEEVVVSVPWRSLMLGTFVSTQTIGALIGAGAFVAFSLWARTPVTMIAGVIGIGTWVWSQVGKNWNFTMTRRDGALRLTRGLLSLSAQSLRPRRIQGVAIKQDLLQRVTGLYQMSVTVLGYGDPTDEEKSGTNAIVLPFGTWAEVLTVLRNIWPEVDLDAVEAHRQPERARWLTPFTFDTHTWGVGEHVLVAQHGLFTQVRTIVPHRRMQSASVEQGPLQRRLRLASISVHTTDGPVSLRLGHLDDVVAREVFTDQIHRARAARQAAEA